MNGDAQPAVRDRIFISYRRDDARGASGRLYDWTRIAFGRERVFRDVHSIGVGRWRDKIDAALARSSLCLAVIGPRWANDENLPRLHDENDMVRREIATALATGGVTMVPTLVEGAELPRIAELPVGLRCLFEAWNARKVTEDGWEEDTRRLIAEIAEATGLGVGPDLDTLLRNVSAARQRVTELEQAQHLQADQIDALRRTVDDLRSKLAEAPAAERPGLAAAFAALARGDTRAAEDAFEREYDAQRRTEEEARRTMAEAARNVANLAQLRDVTKAAEFYRKAMNADPQHAETARLLGHTLMRLGDLRGAEATLAESLRLAREQGDSWGEMAAQGGLGDVYSSMGSLSAARAAFVAALDLAEQGFARDAANTEWQRDLSVSHDRIGDALRAQGDGPGALAAYREGLAIREALAARDRRNAQWQVDVAVSCAKLGTLAHREDVEANRSYLIRGRAILDALKRDGRLMPNQDWIAWFDERLTELAS